LMPSRGELEHFDPPPLLDQKKRIKTYIQPPLKYISVRFCWYQCFVFFDPEYFFYPSLPSWIHSFIHSFIRSGSWSTFRRWGRQNLHQIVARARLEHFCKASNCSQKIEKIPCSNGLITCRLQYRGATLGGQAGHYPTHALKGMS
jgi:hypothetical protein